MANFNYSPYQQYQPYQIPYNQQMMQQQNQQQMQQAVQPQIQNGGFVSVHSSKEALDYPIAPGNSITFIDENARRCYIKTKGFSPFEPPKFDTYKLVKENVTETSENLPSDGVSETQTNTIEYATKEQFDALSARIERLNEEYGSTVSELETLSDVIKVLTTKKPSAKAKKEDAES